MPEIFLLKGIVIGLLFGIPAGAVGALTVQRTINYGTRVGLLTASGSSVADCLYACVGAFGLTFISDFLLRYQTAINLLGGGFLVFLGVRMMIRRGVPQKSETKGAGVLKMFSTSFAVGITNPATTLTFLFAFTYFGISGPLALPDGIQLVAGVFLGTLVWWCVLAAAAGIFKNKFGDRQFRRMNGVFGGILLIFGISVFLKTLFSLE